MTEQSIVSTGLLVYNLETVSDQSKEFVRSFRNTWNSAFKLSLIHYNAADRGTAWILVSAQKEP